MAGGKAFFRRHKKPLAQASFENYERIDSRLRVLRAWALACRMRENGMVDGTGDSAIGVQAMEAKPLWQTKTFWVALAAIITGIGAYATGEATLLESGELVLGGLGGMFLRRGMRK